MVRRCLLRGVALEFLLVLVLVLLWVVSGGPGWEASPTMTARRPYRELRVWWVGVVASCCVLWSPRMEVKVGFGVLGCCGRRHGCVFGCGLWGVWGVFGWGLGGLVVVWGAVVCGVWGVG